MKIPEYDQARSATIVGFRNRLIGGTKLADGRPLISGKARIFYKGNFPFQAVVDKTEVPKDISDKRQVEACWKSLYELFERAWRAYVAASVQDREAQHPASSGSAMAAR